MLSPIEHRIATQINDPAKGVKFLDIEWLVAEIRSPRRSGSRVEPGSGGEPYWFDDVLVSSNLTV